MAKKKRPGAKPSRRNRKRDALIKKLRHYIRTEGPRHLEDKNVTSIGIGYKIKGGRRTRQLCLQFTVASKPEGGTGPEAVEAVEAMDTRMIPPSMEIAGEEIPTDVIERRFVPSYQLASIEETNERKVRVDPLIPGVSVSHPSGTAGTIGMVVFDRQTGGPCILSNWHVLHREPGKIGDEIVQPGPHDDNNVQFNGAGTLIRSHLGAAGDCAIARIEDRGFQRDILELGVTPREVVRVDLDDVVTKSGRTTAVTRGIVRRIDVMAELNYGGSIGVREIGAFEIGPPEDASADFEVSLGGDSGSVWLIADEDGNASDILAGLHFGGERADNPDEHALACYAHAVFKKLDIALEPMKVEDPEAARLGYDPSFTASEVSLPVLSSSQRKDAFKLNGKITIPYTHFSVCLSKSRTLARFVAWNIDGGRLRRLSRKGIGFKLDDRVPDQFQSGNELYSNNKLDRGHIARRADLTWGALAEAKRANRESFRFTNIAPQHESFNQSSRGGIWGSLENAVFEDVDVEDLKVSVLGGPVFRRDDPVHRAVKIPRDFWKLIAYKDSDDGKFKVRAFLLTQRNLLSEIEALELDEFRIFQIPLDRLEQETGLGFEGLKAFDTFTAAVEAEEVVEARIVQAREVFEMADFFV